MKTNQTIGVVIAAGGLGTRALGWSPWLPKVFRPVEGRPGLLHVLEETAAVADRAVVVHHPYYNPLIPWSRSVFSPGALTRYHQLARQPIGQQPSTDRLMVDFIPQRGTYADVTSALNGSAHLRTGDVALIYSDNIDPTHQALARLLSAATPHLPAVLASPFDIYQAASHGVVICSDSGSVRVMKGLVEKPDLMRAARLLAEHGPDNLRLLEGRMRLTAGLIHHLAATSRRATGEPKLSLGLASYARLHRVDVVTSTLPLVDIGSDDEPRAAAA